MPTAVEDAASTIVGAVGRAGNPTTKLSLSVRRLAPTAADEIARGLSANLSEGATLAAVPKVTLSTEGAEKVQYAPAPK